MNIETIVKEIINAVEWVGEEAVALGEAIATLIGIAGPAGLKVATDIAGDVAAGGVTPIAAAAQLADVANFAKALQSAAATLKAQQQIPAEIQLAQTAV